MAETEDKKNENNELTASGYKSVFYAVFGGAWLYLGFLFYKYL